MNSPPLHVVLALAASLLPVVAFLVALILLDSFKLVRPRSILMLVVVGCATAFVSLAIAGGLHRLADLTVASYARYAAPLVEEPLKAAVLLYLIRRRRVGFMVDAAIYGFALGAGFAIVENVYYLTSLPDPSPLVWIVRGFGTAIMHGGVTAIMGILAKYFSSRFGARSILAYLPGLLAAVVIHSAFNHFFITPALSTVGVIVVLPLLMIFVFHRSETATRHWLGVRFDTDAELLEAINSGTVLQSRVGEYLESLKARFSGEVMADMLCMLRIHLELSIRAKGILLMREAGFPVEREAGIEERFNEMKYLEKSIGRTGMLAASAMLNMSDHNLWELYMLGKR